MSSQAKGQCGDCAKAHLYDRLEQSIFTNLYFGTATWILLALLAAFNVVHWLAWLPPLIANTGLIASLAMQLNRIDELRGESCQ